MDGIILKKGNDITKFLKWDYVGAPWAENNDAYYGINEDNIKIPRLPKEYRVGNGGLSIRSVNAMKTICNFNFETTPAEQEDVFFVRHLHKLNFTVANLMDAAEFSVEVPILETNISNLFSFHQAYNFMPKNILNVLTMKGLKHSYFT